MDYRIKSNDGYTEKIGELVSMLEHTREVTLEEIAGLKKTDLDALPHPSSNTIGALLLHIASIEFVHQVVSFEKRDLSEQEYDDWKLALELGDEAREKIHDQPLDYYIEQLNQVRVNTLATLAAKNDQWLLEEDKWDHGVPYNHYYLWFHVMEDEINHRGQIRAIKRLLNQSA
ncbi:DinB family protein [Halobacillus halophilus]|uniref:DinB family protein n=1 Tax=Halobacillus halophilus TaxID=1570 RepID=UPI001CD75A9F|nr:DinB family protein [Halobacillus halophilus]MCA1013028.1 DinB family protein [Halobacillus halophilus]